VSIVGRVFIIINFIVSIGVLIFAMTVWTAPTKWQKMYEQERASNIARKMENEVKQNELAEGIATRDQVIKQYKVMAKQERTERIKREDDLVEVKSELDKVKGDVASKTAQIESQTSMINLLNNDIKTHKDIILKQQQAVTLAQDNEAKARQEKAEMENELNAKIQQNGTLGRDLKTAQETLATQNARLELIAKRVPQEFFGPEGEAPAVALPDAKVLAVKPELDIAVLSIGSANGVKAGVRLTISRGDSYLANAQVERVYPDMCLARLILKKGEVQVGDEAKSSVKSH